MLKARETRSRALVVTALAVSLVTAGCTGFVDQRGNKLDEERMEAVQPGVTTKADLAQLWGTPSAVSTFDDNTWYYIAKRTERVAFFNPDTTEQQVVVVHFDDAGRVTSLGHRGLEDAREIEIVERTTPTIGNEPTLFGSLYQTLLQGPVGALGGGPVTNEGFTR